MMKIDYHNMPNGSSKIKFMIRYILNIIRTWIVFHLKYPWVRYDGFVRVMSHTSFAKREIIIGNNVQFGQYCNIAANVEFRDNILIAGYVRIVGKHDHCFDIPKQLIWQSDADLNGKTFIDDDVWIGNGAIIVGPVSIGKGAVIAAGSVVVSDIPDCEVWGGVPAKKIKDRFPSIEEKNEHLRYLLKKDV
jgi:acetyltransferase-like isoleucine patch superfamily enzyme